MMTAFTAAAALIALGQCPRVAARPRRACAPPAGYAAAPFACGAAPTIPQAYAAPAYAPAAAAPGAVDDGSFVGWLNAERAARGLAPCALDAGLCADAAANSRIGFGHAFMGRARRQNAGWGALPTVCSMWVASPAHADALFDPTITRVGLGRSGDVLTFAAY